MPPPTDRDDRANVAIGTGIAQASGGSTAVVVNAYIQSTDPTQSGWIKNISDIFDPMLPSWTPGLGDSALLRAEQRAVPFSGNAAKTLQDLLSWANDSQPAQSLKLIAGPAGVGKTRLLMEVCEILKEKGWEAGFIASSVSTTDKPRMLQWWRIAGPARLIVVDYAEARPDDVVTLLESLIESQIPQKVRLVLLARNTQSWWFDMLTRSKHVRALAEGTAFKGTHWIAPMIEQNGREAAAFRKAVVSFAGVLKIDTPPLKKLRPPPFLTETIGEPLFLQMAALAYLRGDHPRTISGLIKATLLRERSFWKRLAQRIGLDQIYFPGVTQTVAAATLLGGVRDASSLLSFIQALPKASEYPKEAQLRLRALLLMAFPKNFGIDALRPDRLGEAFIVEELDSDLTLVESIIRICTDRRQLSGVLTVLERIVLRHALARETTLMITLNDAIDTVFRKVRPRTAQILDRALRAQRGNETKLFSTLQRAAEETLAKAGIQATVSANSLSIADIYRRMKIERKPLASVTDRLSLVIIVQSVGECYSALESPR